MSPTTTHLWKKKVIPGQIGMAPFSPGGGRYIVRRWVYTIQYTFLCALFPPLIWEKKNLPFIFFGQIESGWNNCIELYWTVAACHSLDVYSECVMTLVLIGSKTVHHRRLIRSVGMMFVSSVNDLPIYPCPIKLPLLKKLRNRRIISSIDS